MLDKFSVHKCGDLPDHPLTELKHSEVTVKAQTRAHGLQLWTYRSHMSSNQTITQAISETYNRFIYVPNRTAYIGDLGHETEAKAHHTLFFSEDGTSTVRIQTKDEDVNFVMIAGGYFVTNTREKFL
ncbi:hypothetical protein K457DRAFT_25089 [Linnemannia elongata AG-77]|uniref:Uncharacterized protein n=1 Tax=Linnemannia elongata AG-77 TaxID=1314771 RepID=A0A197JE63_9FUNG|nr:hypothetical protein K457DRAFT_25089 [Linnemannia elongata AG-77]